VAQQVGDGDPVLAAGGELRPVPRHRRGQVDLTAVGEQQRGQRRHGLGAGVDVDDRVLPPRPGPGRVGEPAPQVDHRPAVDVHAHRGAHLGAAGQTRFEHRAHRREPVIRTRGLTKKYGTLTAVNRLDLEVFPGEIFGLLGQNGAGKTTTILMLLGLSEPTSGEAAVMGLDPAWEPREVKRRVGYLPDAVGFYGGMTGRQNLRYTARLNGLRKFEAEPAIDEVLVQVGLLPRLKNYVVVDYEAKSAELSRAPGFHSRHAEALCPVSRVH
jgi:ABC-type glutathione transport system ATPase component